MVAFVTEVGRVTGTRGNLEELAVVQENQWSVGKRYAEFGVQMPVLGVLP